MASKAEVIAFLEREFPQFKGIVEEVGNQSAVVRRHITEADLRPGGTVSGPTLFGVADASLYVAILAELGIIALAVTTNLNITFMHKPVANRDIIGRCQLLKVGKTLVVGEVHLYSEGKVEPIAHAIGTYAIPPAR